MLRQRIGHIRGSTIDQKENRQLEGITVDKIFIDKTSGKDTKRPLLELDHLPLPSTEDELLTVQLMMLLVKRLV